MKRSLALEQIAAWIERDAEMCAKRWGLNNTTALMGRAQEWAATLRECRAELGALNQQLAAAREDAERLRREFRALSGAITEGADPTDCYRRLTAKLEEFEAGRTTTD